MTSVSKMWRAVAVTIAVAGWGLATAAIAQTQSGAPAAPPPAAKEEVPFWAVGRPAEGAGAQLRGSRREPRPRRGRGRR